MASFLKHLQNLYELELYTNLLEICNLSITACEQKTDTFSLPNKFQIHFYYAEALFHTQQYARAECVYEQIVQMRKNVIKNKNANKVVDVALLDDIVNDIDIKYKLYLCCMKLDQKTSAITVLESIPARVRTPKINMALGKLYKSMGQQRQAVTCFKEVLRDCPLGLEAVNELLKLGVKGVEVNSLMVEVMPEVPWLNIWLKAQAQLNAKEFTNAIQTFKSMDTYGLLRDNTSLLINMGYCYHYLCEDSKAIAVLQRAYKINPRLLEGKDLLSNLLTHSGNKDHISELESMVPSIDVSLWSTEQFVVFGNYLYSSKKYEKAVFYAHQALMLNKRNVEAFFLKAMTLCQLKKYIEASEHCIEALQICPYRYDLHKCLVDCYIQTNRLKEAETMALNACKQLKFTAQAYTLHAMAIMKDPLASNRSIRRILEKAVAEDKNHKTDALYMLVEFLEQEQQYEQASQLLLKHIEKFPTSRAHQLLGDCFFNLHKDDEAFDHYKIALKLDPKNQRALEGLNNIGRTTSGSKRDSYYSCVGESSYNSQCTNASDDADPESDTDHNISSILFT